MDVTDLPPAATESLARVRRYTWWSLVPIAPVMGAVTIWLLMVMDRPWPVTAVLIAFALAVCAAGCFLLDRSLRVAPYTLGALGSSGRTALAVGAGGLVAGAGLTAATGGVLSAIFEWSPLAAVMAGNLAILAPKGRRAWVILGCTAAMVAAGAAAGAGGYSVVPGVAVLLGAWGSWQTWWYHEVARQLDLARLQAGELAVANERLRFAAELHDIQGHHLQVIALKSELAARLAGADPVAAVAQIRQVQQLAREALTDTRSLVGGYRKVSLGTEIANATRVLAAADIDARPRVAAPTDHRLGPAERLFGLVVREATTNILRHAKAGQARIELTEADRAVRLVIANDGAGAPVSATGVEQPAGGGLPALAERLAAAGGRLEWGRQGDEFTVTATTAPLAPAPSPDGQRR